MTQEEIKNSVEDSFLLFCNTFRKQPQEAIVEIELFTEELSQSLEKLKTHVSNGHADYQEWYHAVHGIKSILAVFGFAPVVEEANRLMVILKSKPDSIRSQEFDGFFNCTDYILQYFNGKKNTYIYNKS